MVFTSVSTVCPMRTPESGEKWCRTQHKHERKLIKEPKRWMKFTSQHHSCLLDSAARATWLHRCKFYDTLSSYRSCSRSSRANNGLQNTIMTNEKNSLYEPWNCVIAKRNTMGFSYCFIERSKVCLVLPVSATLNSESAAAFARHDWVESLVI